MRSCCSVFSSNAQRCPCLPLWITAFSIFLHMQYTGKLNWTHAANTKVFQKFLLGSTVVRGEKRLLISMCTCKKKKKNSQTKIGPLMHCLKIYGASAPHEATCVFICVQKSKKGWWGLRSLPVSTHFCERAMCNGDGHFLSQLIPYPDSAGSCSARCTPCARPPKPLVFMGLFALSLPSLEILFIICGEGYCLEILVFISLLALTDTQGKGGREGWVEKAFGFVLWYAGRLC